MSCRGKIDQEMYYTILATFSGISILGSLFIIISYSLFKSSRGYFNSIVLYMAIEDTLRSGFFIFRCDKEYNYYTKNISGIILESSILVNIFWSVCISVTLYQVVVLSMEDIDKYHKYWLAVGFGVIPSIFVLPIVTDSYGLEYNMCVLNMDNTGYIWRMTIDYTPGLLLIILSIFFCIRFNLTLKKIEIESKRKKILQNVMLYPILTILDLAPIFLSRTFEHLGYNCEILVQISTLGLTLHGLINASLFGMTSSTVLSIRKSLDRRRQDSCVSQESLSIDEKFCTPNLLLSSAVLS